MSWISQNYEKVAIGTGFAVAAGLAFLGWSQLNAVGTDFSASGNAGKDNNVAVEGAEKIPQTISSLGQKRAWTQAMAAGDRPVDLFTGIPLFLKKDAPTVAIDLRTDAPVHAGIPNSWWLENHLDLGFADSPQRDPDKDGFSNAEEFAAKTDPNNPESHPTLIDKLKFVRDKSLQWLLDPGMEANPGEFSIQYFDSDRGQNRMGAVTPAKVDEPFFTKGVMMGRFILRKSEKVQEENPRTHSIDDKTYLSIEDQKPNKKGTVYRIPNNIPLGLKKDYYQYDRSAVMSLEAAGKNGQEFIVEENTTFSLPEGTDKKDYLLKKVTPEAIEVEYKTPTGETKTISIPKGTMPSESH